MLRHRLKTILLRLTITLSLAFTLGIGSISYAVFDLENEMQSKLESKRFLTSTEIYSAALKLSTGDLYSIQNLTELLKAHNFRQRSANDILLPLDFAVFDSANCQQKWSIKANNCTELRNAAGDSYLFVFQTDDLITQIYKNKAKTAYFTFEPQLLAQYVGDEPTLHESFSFNEVPNYCSLAVMAIEDQRFLEHNGVSVKGIFRALSKNLIEGKKSQGGSTITQQLVKNFFLSPEKTYSRKAKEVAMAVLLEGKYTKEQILEMYLNIIYLGQNGAYQVKGYKSAAKYYFGKNLTNLNLGECALLAAVVNSPGLFNPFKNPDKARTRRELVLNKMHELNLINDAQKIEASQLPLPTSSATLAAETAPYYVDAVKKQVQTLGLPWDGSKIFTGLNLQSQAWAQTALNDKIQKLELQNKTIKNQKEKGLLLQGVVLSGDPKTGLIEVAVGGRNFKTTQFNRAIQAKRQIGSIMKPFVFLSAFSNGKNLDSIVDDSPITIKTDAQSWTPQNYDKKFRGPVTLEFALQQSLNVPTVKIGMEVGLDKVIETAREFGIESNLNPLPSLTLGAFEMSHQEVLKAYMGLSQMGSVPNLSFIEKIENSNQQVIWSFQPQIHSYAKPNAVFDTVKALEGATQSGTSAAISKSNFKWHCAGKTGTTSDYKDAWFAGFTPSLTTVVWLGYDNNTPHQLTGASGPLSIWIDFMSKRLERTKDIEFTKKSEAP